MIKRLLPLLMVLAVALPATADLRAVERELRSHLGRPTYIPMLGLVRFATWIVHPHGVHDFQLTVWDDKRPATEMNGAEMEQIFRSGLAPEFQPVVRVRSRREFTFIYARPVGERFEMMLLTHDHSDTVLLRADVDIEQLGKMMRDHDHGRSMFARR